MQEFVAEPCDTEPFYLGECCRWDEVRQELYWVNVDAGHFFRARVDRHRVEIVRRYDVAGSLTAVAPLANRSDGWIIAVDQSIGILDEAGDLTIVARPEERNAAHVRMNDGAADPWGRFWIGSMAKDHERGRGSLYRYDDLIGMQTIVAGAIISNGLGWSPDHRTMYYVDSGPGTIVAFDVDDDGEVSGPRTLVQFSVDQEGAPDGLCVDREGAIWVAVWGGREIRRYAPTGRQLARVRVDTPQPSSCAIGGANRTTLYITTAQEDLSSDVLAREPNAGRLFCADVGVEGQAIDAYRPSQLNLS